MRSIISNVEYQDVPEFSDLVLHPALDRGHSLSIFTSFVPSYLVELAATLRSTERVEPGKVNLVLGIPNLPGFFDRPVQGLIAYLKALQIDDLALEGFLKDVLFLVAENSLSLKLLVARESRVLASGCVGLLEDGKGKPDFAILQDFLEGDSNSPIRPICSWKTENPAEFSEVFELLSKVFFGESSEGFVISQTEAVDLFREIVQKHWLSATKSVPKPKKDSQKKRANSKVAQAADDEEYDDALDELDSADFWLELNQSWDELVVLSTRSDMTGESLADLLDAFGWDDLPPEWESALDRSKRIKEGFGDDYY